MSITSSAVLVELNVSVWTANKLDKQATADVTSSNHAASDAASVRKNLMAGTNLRKEIADFAASCRLWHSQKTLPWADRGSRMLPTSMFIDYKREIDDRQQKFNLMVDDFINAYPILVGVAQHNLGSLFKPEDYPDVDDVRTKFGFRLVFSPIPESGDFRLAVPEQDLREMKEQYEHDFNNRLEEAMREPWDRLYKLISSMAEKLADTAGEEKKRYHDTFITNAQDLCVLLTHLNITKDPQLEKARRDLERTMRGKSIDVIKESPEARGEMKRNLDAILKKYEW